MEREIKFRGIVIDDTPGCTGKFVEGYLTKEINDFYIEVPSMDISLNAFKIDPNTIGQFTSLKDKNGKEIYEGDICRILYSDWPSNSNPEISHEDYLISISSIGQIQYHAPSFYIMLYDKYGDLLPNSLNHGKHGFIEVIGNIYENPELLK